MEKKYRKHFAVMVLCFLVGGFSIILFAIQAYSAFTGMEIYGSFREFRPPSQPDINVSNEGFNFTSTNGSFPNRNFDGRFRPLNPIGVILSPFSLVLLFVGIVSIISGISIFFLVREKEIKSTKDNLTSILLTPEEKKILEEIKNASGDITQSQLVLKTQLSKVKVHRIITRLEAKGIVKKYGYGVTNKIVLEKDI